MRGNCISPGFVVGLSDFRRVIVRQTLGGDDLIIRITGILSLSITTLGVTVLLYSLLVQGECLCLKHLFSSNKLG